MSGKVSRFTYSFYSFYFCFYMTLSLLCFYFTAEVSVGGLFGLGFGIFRRGLFLYFWQNCLLLVFSGSLTHCFKGLLFTLKTLYRQIRWYNCSVVVFYFDREVPSEWLSFLFDFGVTLILLSEGEPFLTISGGGSLLACFYG